MAGIPVPDDIRRLLFIWDLDGTLVDSQHRTMWGKGWVRTEEQLGYWLDMSTPHWIRKDTPLPLARIQRRMKDKFGGYHVVLTARTLSDADVAYLGKHHMVFDHLLHREGSVEANDTMKRKRLGDFLQGNPSLVPFLAFDDEEPNHQLYLDYGFSVVDPRSLNRTFGKTN